MFSTREWNGGTPSGIVSPIPYGDGCTVMPDGSIVIARARDYHLDWIDPSGRVRHLPVVPHTVERLSGSAKVSFIDSVAAWDTAHSPHPRLLPSPEELPDVRPPFLGEQFPPYPAVHGDLDGNVWIETRAPQNGSEYDVVNRNGLLIDRVKLAPGQTIVAFGPGVAYVVSEEAWGQSVARVELRAR